MFRPCLRPASRRSAILAESARAGESPSPAAGAVRAHGLFVRLCAVGFLAYCSYTICRTPLLPLLARELGAGPVSVGFLVGASTLTGVFLKLPAGAWSDVLGRRPLLLLGTVIFAVMPFTYVGITSLAVLVALRVVHGSATAIFSPVTSAIVSDLAPATRRATWFSTYSTIQGLGQALGPVVAGYLIARGGYDVAFVGAGLIGAAAPFIAGTWPRPPESAVRAPRVVQFAAGIRDVCREPLILMTSVAQAAQFVLNGALNAFLPLFAHDVIGVRTTHLGWLLSVQVLTTLAARPLMGAIADRVERRAAIVSGLVACSGGVLVVSAASSVRGLVIGIVLYAAGVAVTSTAASAFITDLSRHARYGAAHGLFGTIYDVGDAIGPIAAGVLVAVVGYTHMFQVMAAVAVTVGVVFYVVSRDAR
jgi:MFS transporter, DHA1 family, multidrug resistance protein